MQATAGQYRVPSQIYVLHEFQYRYCKVRSELRRVRMVNGQIKWISLKNPAMLRFEFQRDTMVTLYPTLLGSVGFCTLRNGKGTNLNSIPVHFITLTTVTNTAFG